MTCVFKKGDIFEDPSEVYVNPVNCVGVMGAGLALQFKRRFPNNFEEYRKACRSGFLKPGVVLTYRTWQDQPKFIINVPTKRHWRDKSRIEDIEVGLKAIRDEMAIWDMTSVAVPALGAGLGGLDWEEVKKIIQAILYDLDVTVYEPLR